MGDAATSCRDVDMQLPSEVVSLDSDDEEVAIMENVEEVGKVEDVEDVDADMDEPVLPDMLEYGSDDGDDANLKLFANIQEHVLSPRPSEIETLRSGTRAARRSARACEWCACVCEWRSFGRRCVRGGRARC